MHMLKPTYTLPTLPPPVDLETVKVLKALNLASRALADLKGQARTIPNQGILIDTLALQEAKASSEVENIVTTQDELFQADLFPDGPQSPAAKEVARYRDALRLGLSRLLETSGLIPNSTLIDMFRLLKDRDDGFRVTPGTALKNERNGDIVFVPPQDANEIVTLMTALERFVNDDAVSDLDPLIKMALIPTRSKQARLADFCATSVAMSSTRCSGSWGRSSLSMPRWTSSICKKVRPTLRSRSLFATNPERTRTYRQAN